MQVRPSTDLSPLPPEERVGKLTGFEKTNSIRVPGKNFIKTEIRTIGDLFFRTIKALIRSFTYVVNRLEKGFSSVFPPGIFMGDLIEDRGGDSETLPEAAEAGMVAGLPNGKFFGPKNTCWFNSLMKFMASTDAFDDMFLRKESDDEDRAMVRTYLRHLVIALRISPRGTINWSEYTELMEVLKRVPMFEERIGQQNDPVEFFVQLSHFLNFEPAEDQIPQFGVQYESLVDGARKYGRPNDGERHTFIPIHIPEEFIESKNPINLSACLVSPTQLDVRPDEGGAGDNLPFNKILFPTSLPQDLFLQINREKLNQESYERASLAAVQAGKEAPHIDRYSDKIRNKIVFGENRELTFTIYRPATDDHGRVVGKEPVQNKVYRVAASVIHRGASARGGHYVATENLADGTRIKHDDTSIIVTERPLEEEAKLLHLVWVRNEEI